MNINRCICECKLSNKLSWQRNNKILFSKCKEVWKRNGKNEKNSKTERFGLLLLCGMQCIEIEWSTTHSIFLLNITSEWYTVSFVWICLYLCSQLLFLKAESIILDRNHFQSWIQCKMNSIGKHTHTCTHTPKKQTKRKTTSTKIE